MNTSAMAEFFLRKNVGFEITFLTNKIMRSLFVIWKKRNSDSHWLVFNHKDLKFAYFKWHWFVSEIESLTRFQCKSLWINFEKLLSECSMKGWQSSNWIVKLILVRLYFISANNEINDNEPALVLLFWQISESCLDHQIQGDF